MQTPVSALPVSLSVSRVATAPVAVATLIAVSLVVRIVAVFERSTPRYFPDEYLYAELARSLGRGDGISVLGAPSTFPALLQPLLAAPIWGLVETETAFRLTQVFNVTAMSLAALPVYLLARRLGLTTGWAVTSAAITLVAPALLYSGYVTADALGYLLALTAVLAAVRAQTVSTRTAEATFLVAAGLATFARVQYAVLVVAFAVVAVATERRHVVRRYPLTVATITIGVVALGFAGSAILGRYGSVSTFGVSRETLAWAPSTAFLLGVVGGVAIVPGAVAWLATLGRDTGRERAGFARLTVALALLLAVAAVVMSVETGSDRFLERYLIVLTPLFFVAFACWTAELRPNRRLGVVVALLLIVGAARLPLSEFAAGMGRADSPLLMAVGSLAERLGVGEASLFVAAVVTAMALAGLASCVTAQGRSALVVATSTVLLAALSVGAHAQDINLSKRVSARTFDSNPAWVDSSGAADVLLVQTPGSDRATATSIALWNGSIRRATALTDDVEPIDGMVGTLSFDDRGFATRDGEPIVGNVLWATGGSRSFVTGATSTVHTRYFTLTRSPGRVRIAALAVGLTAGGQLLDGATIRVFAAGRGVCRIATMRLEARASSPIRLRVGGRSLSIRPGTPVEVRLRETKRPVTIETLGGRSAMAAHATIAVADPPCGR